MISSENRKYVVYKTVCKITGKIYVGKDTKNNPAYLGSGTILRHALRASKSGGFRCKKGVLNPMWGKKHSLNSRKKFSEAKKGIYDGAKNPKAKITAAPKPKISPSNNTAPASNKAPKINDPAGRLMLKK